MLFHSSTTGKDKNMLGQSDYLKIKRYETERILCCDLYRDRQTFRAACEICKRRDIGKLLSKLWKIRMMLRNRRNFFENNFNKSFKYHILSSNNYKLTPIFNPCFMRGKDRYGSNFTDDHEKIMSADNIIFPGVGEASSAMKFLKDHRLDDLIKKS